MDYGRVIPRSRNGTSGVCVENTLPAARDSPAGTFMFTPERVASIGWCVAIPRVAGNEAAVVIEVSLCQTESIGDSGDGGVWCNVYNVNKIVTLDGAETGVSIAADGSVSPTTDGSTKIIMPSGREVMDRSAFVYDSGCTVNTVSAIRVRVLYSNCDVRVAFNG